MQVILGEIEIKIRHFCRLASALSGGCSEDP